MKRGELVMSELNQKEVNEQMYLFVKRWLDDLPFEEMKKVPVMAIGYCLAMLSKQDELLKEQESTINELQNAYGYLQKQFFEAQDKLLKEHGKKPERVMRIIRETIHQAMFESEKGKDFEDFVCELIEHRIYHTNR